MSRKKITENVKKRLYADSMGRCMNPDCQEKLFINDRDIVEKAHIIPYCETEDNSYENLIILCPNCHTRFDKGSSYNIEKVKSWKRIREEELDNLFSKKFKNFDELKSKVKPLLIDNKTIYEKYYLGDKKNLWDKFEGRILVNNRMLKKILEQNLNLIQRNSIEFYSNLEYVNTFIMHIDEFEATRPDDEKEREVLFPKEINSIFGIAPVDDDMLPSTESLELLIIKLNEEGKFESISMGDEDSYILLKEDGELSKLYLNDTPRLRQLYFEYHCFRSTKVRLTSLNFAYKFMKSRGVNFEFDNFNNLREVTVCGIKMIFVYEYCLNKVDLMNLSPEENSVVINLHNWNGESCISSEANELSKKMNVTLLTMEDYYIYVHKLKQRK
ncbi:HNH endonuclease signature motif containing protein [Listeria booriae]|uniref:HNH endonuclease n=1 Tax=Listeria booriae TaxID=1552123 RepID=A0A7X0XYF1_9LIST|nr:HNH endonuclease signature motif containing protein [Listeria booriae]MBC1793656.1 HNH endonuclease [Listeria booriae]